MLRKSIFWAHLVAGVVAGLVILMMSVTGVLLTYERQILAWSASTHHVPPAEQGDPLPLEELLAQGELIDPAFTPGSIVISRDAGAPVTLRAGRSGALSLNPYTGESMHTASPALESFFSTVTALHRWFALSGESRGTGRAITGASNLLFLFLIVSGLYLWLPAVWKWAMFRYRLLFNPAVPNGKARDYNWHHVLGFWSAIPLLVVVATATVFYYDWANNMVYAAFGEQPPQRGRGGSSTDSDDNTAITDSLSLDRLTERAREAAGPVWQQLSISLPATGSPTLDVSVDRGNGGQPQLRETLVLDRRSGEVLERQPFSSQSPGQQARVIIRFLHTGEVLGWWGQTIAGLVSLTSVLMVWTGLALAWRRLVRPLLSRRRQQSADQAILNPE